MTTTQQPISAYSLKSLVEKLRPGRFPGMSAEMAALVGYVLGARFAEPSIKEIAITSDGSVPRTRARRNQAEPVHRVL